MKIFHLPQTVILFLIAAPGFIFAQSPIDTKKKKNIPVNTSSLNATSINGNTYGKTGRSASTVYTQSRILNQSILQDQPHKIVYSSETQLPSFIETKRSNVLARSSSAKDVRKASYDYLLELNAVLQVDKPETDFVIQRIKTDKNNKTHVRLNQYYKNVPVHGAEVVVHLNEFGEGEAFNGKYFSITKEIEVKPTVSVEHALAKLKSHVLKGKTERSLTSLERKMIQYEEPKSTLCVYEDKSLVKTHVLAYHVVYCPSLHQRWEYFVDAHTGNILHHFNTTCSIDGPRTASATDLNGVSRSVNTYQSGTNYFMLDTSRPMFDAPGSTLPDEPVGGILTIDMNNTFGDNPTIKHISTTNNVWSNAKAVSAHFNAGAAYEYYRTNHSRNSINGSDGTIISIINVADETGQLLDNAFWNGKAMFYGNGNVSFKPLAGSMDVAGHEMTHGVVENTANLEYQGESGAINESMADIFGSMMDPNDWLIGEDIVKAGAFPSGALRSLSDPHNGGNDLSDAGFQPKHMNEAYTGSQDNGGVHINSGITNHAFFKYAEAITRQKAANVFYKALDDYLTKSSQFIDLRLAVIKAAGDLFGTNSNEVTQAGIAFDAVGITTGQGGDYEDTLPTNPGTEFLLVYNTDLTNANKLYRSSPEATNLKALTTTPFASKPSVTDDGSSIVFVAEDQTIHVLTMDGGEVVDEFVLQNEAIWSNAVISKGGNRMAAVTTAWDNKIYVYDFITEEWAEFELYNPTYSDVNSGGTVYADALDFDYTGEYLVYDCFNRIENSTGTDIEYWDVNFIRVWNKEANDFGDGEVSKLFASLPQDVSVGNPSNAKNTPNVIAFDYIDDVNEVYAVLGSNIETSEVNVIVENDGLGWPSFNKNDSRIAFTLGNGSGDYNTGYVPLNADKISSSGVVTNLHVLSMWPVYFSTGDRGFGNGEVTGIPEERSNISLTCFPNPFEDQFFLNLTDNFVGESKIEISNLVGQPLSDFNVQHIDNKSLALKINNLPAGQYIVRVRNGLKSGACKMVKR